MAEISHCVVHDRGEFVATGRHLRFKIVTLTIPVIVARLAIKHVAILDLPGMESAFCPIIILVHTAVDAI